MTLADLTLDDLADGLARLFYCPPEATAVCAICGRGIRGRVRRKWCGWCWDEMRNAKRRKPAD